MKNIILYCNTQSPETIDKLKNLVKPSVTGQDIYMLLLPTSGNKNLWKIELRSDVEITPLQFYQDFVLNIKLSKDDTIECIPKLEGEQESIEAAKLGNDLLSLPALYAQQLQTKQKLVTLEASMNAMKEEHQGPELIAMGDKQSKKNAAELALVAQQRKATEAQLAELSEKTQKLTELLMPTKEVSIKEAIVNASEKQQQSFLSWLFPVKKQHSKSKENNIPNVLAENLIDARLVDGDLEPMTAEEKKKQVNKLGNVMTELTNVSTERSELKKQKGMRLNASTDVLLHINPEGTLEELAQNPKYRNAYVLKNAAIGKEFAFITEEGQILKSSIVKSIQINMLNRKIDDLASTQNKTGDVFEVSISKQDLDIIKGYTVKPEVFSSQTTQKYKDQVPREQSPDAENKLTH